MAFRIKNISKFPVGILGVTLQPGSVVDLQTSLADDVIRASILNGELYDKIQGRMLTVLSPPRDWGQIGLSTDELARLMHAGFFKGFLGLEDLKPPFQFDGYGSLTTVSAGFLPGVVTAVRGIVADGGVADGIPVEVGGVDEAGNIQSLLVNDDGYLMTSTVLSIELNNEVEGRVADGEDGTGIKPVIISGIDEDGYSQSMLVSGDGELHIRAYDAPADAIRTFETAPVNTTFLLETLVDLSNQAVDTYYYTVTMDNYKDLSLEMDLSANATVTLEASSDATFTNPKDITLSGTELVSAVVGFLSFSNDSVIVDFDNLNVSYVRVKLVISNATNSAKIISRKKAL
jgi:hypothetical protein